MAVTWDKNHLFRYQNRWHIETFLKKPDGYFDFFIDDFKIKKVY